MIGTDLERAKKLLQAGELVAIPTETVYGLAGNAYDEVAVSEVFRVKERPSFDPLIVHTSELARAEAFVLDIPAPARKLAERFMPGPLTLLLPRDPARISDLVTAASPLVAVRVPRHPLTQELLRSLSFPLVAPSANPFGYISPTTAQHVEDQLGERISYILDGGPCVVGIESTIIGWEGGVPQIFRKGGISVEAIEEVIGPVKVRPHSSARPHAPGMLKSHYAPRVPVVIGELSELARLFEGSKVGVIAFRKRLSGIPKDHQVILSERGDFGEAARNLFAAMRYLDGLELDLILTELLPEEDLGRAINDRLQRAAAEK